MLHSLIRAAAEGETPNPLIPAVYDIVWSLVPFAIILVLFWKVVLPRMRTMLDERAELIEGGITKAEKAQEEANAALEQYRAQLADARGEAGKIRETARLDAGRIVSDAKEQATVEAARISATGLAQIEAERQSALVSLRSEVGSLALDLASGVIGESLSEDKKATAIVDRFLADLEADEKAKAAK